MNEVLLGAHWSKWLDMPVGHERIIAVEAACCGGMVGGQESMCSGMHVEYE